MTTVSPAGSETESTAAVNGKVVLALAIFAGMVRAVMGPSCSQ